MSYSSFNYDNVNGTVDVDRPKFQNIKLFISCYLTSAGEIPLSGTAFCVCLQMRLLVSHVLVFATALSPWQQIMHSAENTYN